MTPTTSSDTQGLTSADEDQKPAPAKRTVPEFLPVRRVTATFLVPEDTNWNDLKNWVKTCPYSQPGDQTLGWTVEQIKNPDYTGENVETED